MQRSNCNFRLGVTSVVGQAGSRLPIVNRPLAAFASSHEGRLTIGRRLPACPTFFLLRSLQMATKVTTLPNGPLRIEGEFSVCDGEGREFGLAGRTVISLCRCGHSQNKPFCDG